ncbi:MAG: mechanosensitive ion channel [Bacteroidales bacterium]|nr:mechanosensitive ion channel [Bacteroidales bacterium]
MKSRKLITILVALLVVAVPATAVFTGMGLDATLSNLRRELNYDYLHISSTREQMAARYDVQHQKMVDIVKKCNDLSLMLYSQKQDYTFDISYALEKVCEEFNDFNKNRTPYDRIVSSIDVEINRYARLIESLRRLPPELREVEVVPDSLAYHNDSLDVHLMQNESLLQQELEEQVKVILASKEAFILSESGQADRDSCLLYASELLKLYAERRELVMADSTHYREAELRMQESYEYARSYYSILEKKVFVEGQTPWFTILKDPGAYWREARGTLSDKFGDSSISSLQSIVSSNYQQSNQAKFYWLLFYFLAFIILWMVSVLILNLLHRFVKPIRERVAPEQKLYLAFLVACVLFLVLSYESVTDDIARKGMSIMRTFIWLLMAINTALLLRLEPQKLKHSILIYVPTIFTALFVIGLRVLFVPNAVLNMIFPPLLLVMTLWQLLANLRRSRKTDRTDMVIGWTSLFVTAAALVISWIGYIFLALILLVWWYFQLALNLTIASVWSLMLQYKSKRLNKRIAAFNSKTTYVAGAAKKEMQFRATWFYDLIREVLVPVMALCSLPICLYLAMNIFEFNDLYYTIFEKPFIRQGDISISAYSLLLLLGLFAVFRYANKAIHVLWQSFRYRQFLRKYNRKTVHNNEINLALGNSLISVFIWFVYVDLVIVTLNIPTGSLGLIAGGLSAGIGLALKDIINNFIYGIQLMGGRLRVGDWIECDGVRGKVVDINYQTTLVETLFGTQVAFLNASLFSKSFTNLTRNNAYELTIIKVGVAYGTDFQKVREALEKGLEVLKTKDKYGRDIVEPTYGHYIRFDDFGDSSVNVAVRQYVLVSEQIEYRYQCKELIYKILKENGITIPFPQRDVHLIQDNKTE